MLSTKSKAVHRLFRMADRHVFTFQQNSEISCVPGCGKCCLKKDLNVTILEFLPAAFTLYNTGRHEQIMEKLETAEDTVCAFFNPFSEQGNCSMYPDRGLLCRLFGFTAKSDKNGNKSLVTCSIIKNGLQKDIPGKIIAKAPDLSSYYLRMYGIDPRLSVQYLPINQAIYEALKLVIFESGFRKKPA